MSGADLSGRDLTTMSAQITMVSVGPGGTNSFSPASVTITVGSTVTWNWATGTHSVTQGSCSTSCTATTGGFDSGIKSSGSFSHVFPTAGTFSYFCLVHGALMQGTITVQ
jgi:plastocyanin